MTDADVTRLAGKESDATRLSVGKFDATRLAGESYRTRIVPSTTIDDQTRIAEGSFQSKLTRDAGVEPLGYLPHNKAVAISQRHLFISPMPHVL